jgi:hypothetical protein
MLFMKTCEFAAGASGYMVGKFFSQVMIFSKLYR